MEEELDFTKLKYVLYARKSTDDPQRQIRSIDDQIYDCQLVQSRLGLNVVKILKETKSAKKPNNRPIFTQVLKDLRNGVYDGILAWNPDRLARNMKEGGEIIDMIDEEKIVDLKFVTHHFSKDANGKMLLGMAFVLSKQYSDDLSQKVTRGVRRNLAEGKTSTPKHGYIRTEEGTHKPDDENFKLIKKVWEMRVEGESFLSILDFLEKNKYGRKTKTGRKIKMFQQSLTDLFKDPFYYGILIQKGHSVDLREAYNFEPMITEEVYNRVQQLTYRKINTKEKPTSAFYPLKGLIICSECKRPRYIGPSTSHTGKRYLNARCGTKSCSMRNKSIRMIKIFDFMYSFLENGLNFSESEYKQYFENLTNIHDIQRQKLTIDLNSRRGYLKHISGEISDRSLNIIKLDKNSTAWSINERKIESLAQEVVKVKNMISELEDKINKPEVDRLTLEEFLNLSKNAGNIIQSANAGVKDLISRKIFLNLIVDNEKVLNYQLKEPFTALLKQRNMSPSRGGGN